MLSGKSTMCLLSFGVLMTMGIVGVHAGYLPSALEACPANDDVCFTKQAQIFVSAYKHGIPDRKVPSLEPINVSNLNMPIGDKDSSMHLHLNTFNTTVHNFGNSVIVKSLKIRGNDLDKPVKVNIIFTAPYVMIRGDYELKGKLLILPINSAGKMDIRVDNVKIETRIVFKPELAADGHSYLKIDSFKPTGSLKGGHVELTNLFKNNEELSRSTLKVLNEEWETLEHAFRPKIMIALSNMFREIVQSILDTIPFDELYSKDSV